MPELTPTSTQGNLSPTSPEPMETVMQLPITAYLIPADKPIEVDVEAGF